MSTLKCKSTLSMILLLMAFTVVSTVRGQSRQANPPGNWTVSAGPYFGPGYESIPVDVFSVTSNAERGFAVVSIALSNRSGRDVSAVKLRWYLKDEGQQGRLLLEGDTALIDVDLPAGREQTLTYPVVTFARAVRPLLRGGSLRGNYRIEIAVSEVNYADGQAWLIGAQGGRQTYRQVVYRSPAPAECQGQGCAYVVARDSYICLIPAAEKHSVA